MRIKKCFSVKDQNKIRCLSFNTLNKMRTSKKVLERLNEILNLLYIKYREDKTVCSSVIFIVFSYEIDASGIFASICQYMCSIYIYYQYKFIIGHLPVCPCFL